MKTTTATIKHLDYVPSGWFALEFCKVYFYGFRAEEMKKKLEDIEKARYNEYNFIYEKNQIKIQNLRDKSNTIYKKVSESKPFYRFFYNKVERSLLAQAQTLDILASQLEEKNKNVKVKRFFDFYEYHRKIEELLNQNEFIPVNTYFTGEGCVIKTEIWKCKE